MWVGFLVKLCMAILEKLLVQGTVAFTHYIALKNELESNSKKSDSYQKIVDNQTSTREERKSAEDELLS